jgi:hypothetical protein
MSRDYTTSYLPCEVCGVPQLVTLAEDLETPTFIATKSWIGVSETGALVVMCSLECIERRAKLEASTS